MYNDAKCRFILSMVKTIEELSVFGQHVEERANPGYKSNVQKVVYLIIIYTYLQIVV
jgi:hypothetical protein